MSTVTSAPDSSNAPQEELATAAANRNVGVRTFRPAIGLAILALVALLLFALNAASGSVEFRLSDSGDAVQLPNLSVPITAYGWVVAAALAALAVFAAVRARSLPRWALILAGFFFVTGFLVWIVGTAQTPSISVTALLAGSVALATPLIFGSLGGLLCERSGVVNIAIEAQLLFGAFSAAVAATLANNVWVGLLAAVIGSMLVSLVLAIFSIKYRVNQVIVGVVLNV
ncbi:MAG: ABC transporter permease, partial [Kocuria sp.]|nr:ABC transporter permease [Kocuria sp.]